ncbi:ATPase, K+ transporting, KdpC subunit [Candidatus Magnetoovum chiemensis]|nr:ATPase, K+ transporting, KdpC subunit [Candidatus Magnetoovum chiemensis]
MYIQNALAGIKMLLVLSLITGALYTSAVTLVGSVFFKNEVNGSLIYDSKGALIGSELIGQKFESERYFWSRPSAANYGTVPSGASNYGYLNPKLKDEVYGRYETFKKHKNDLKLEDIPSELLFTSASGLDPDISVEGAKFQVDRIMAARSLSYDKKPLINALIEQLTQKRDLGIFGKERVNVLRLNVELDKLSAGTK